MVTKMEEKKQGFLEVVVMAAILLVLVQTVLEDAAVLAGWPWNIRRALVFTGFGFDLFFTVEFLVRFYLAVSRGKVRGYLFRERGWIDFFASVPLLMFNSGPMAASLLFSGSLAMGAGGILNLLKVIKAIRIARVLRLLRFVKIFREIKYVDSPMAQRHVASVTTMGVSAVIFTIIGFSTLGAVFPFPDSGTLEERNEDLLIAGIEGSLAAGGAWLSPFLETRSEILILEVEGKTVFSRFPDEYYQKWFGPNDYRYVEGEGCTVFLDGRMSNAMQSRDNLMYCAVIIVMVVVYLFIYSPHFAMTVSDPIYVMRKGMEENGYNLEVKEDPRFPEDDIFALARAYNETFLPLKNRQDGGAGKGALSLDQDAMRDLFTG